MNSHPERKGSSNRILPDDLSDEAAAQMLEFLYENRPETGKPIRCSAPALLPPARSQTDRTLGLNPLTALTPPASALLRHLRQAPTSAPCPLLSHQSDQTEKSVLPLRGANREIPGEIKRDTTGAFKFTWVSPLHRVQSTLSKRTCRRCPFL